MIIDVCGRGAIGKGILRNWQRPGSGRGGGGQEGGWVGRRDGNGEGETGNGQRGWEMGRGAMVRGETGKGRWEGEKGQEEGISQMDMMGGHTLQG